MAKCSICSHPERASIDKALVSGEAYRSVAARFAAPPDAVYRHKRSHLVDLLIRAEQIKQQHVAAAQRSIDAVAVVDAADALDVDTELRNVFRRMNKLMDACDQWLSDPDAPDRYDLSPRAHEVNVIYEETVDGANGRDRIVTRKETLQALLDKVEEIAGDGIQVIELKHADPRKLIIDAANALRPSIELLAKLVGRLDESPKISVYVDRPNLSILTDDELANLEVIAQKLERGEVAR